MSTQTSISSTSSRRASGSSDTRCSTSLDRAATSLGQTRDRDPSLRAMTNDDTNLESPFYLIDTFDELAKVGGLTLKSVGDFCNPNSLIRCGRPMWVTQTPEDAVGIARYKLV